MFKETITLHPLIRNTETMKNEAENINQDIVNMILERPYPFEVDHETRYLYPVTLGKSLLISELLKGIDVNGANIHADPLAEALRLCVSDRDTVCRVIAIQTMRTKEEVFDKELISARKNEISGLESAELATLFVASLGDTDVERFARHFGIDKERKWQEKALKAKKDSNTLSFGGKSIYGTLIDNACQRYGWSFEYVVWGISYMNLKMLMSDIVNTVFLTDEERKRVRIPNDRNVINMDDPKNREIIKRMKWD